jgi:phytoene dehydrogenase-like protein
LLTSLRGIDERGAVDVTRLLTGSIADLLEGYFESDAMLGLLSVSGVIGTWAGPRSAGTAYVMLHHHIGETDGAAGAWGFPRGGMGGVSGALARAARMFGAQIRTDAEVAQIRTSGGRVTGVTLASGEAIDAPLVVTTAHPQISFLRLLDPAELPAEFVADIRGWRSRSGTVKINLALDRLPVFTSHPEPDPQVYGGTIVLAESLDDIETAYQQAVAGEPAWLPFADICIPSVFDDSLAPASKHVMSMFTQWVPSGYADAPHEAELEAYADRVLARVEKVAPGFTASVLHRQVIGPHRMQEEYGLVGGNIFHGELSLGQMFHARPAAGYADLRTPVRGLYQAGSATHGGGGVTGIPGRNVVRQILADRRTERWRRRVSRPSRPIRPSKPAPQQLRPAPEPRRCHIVVVRTTTESHRRGCRRARGVWWLGTVGSQRLTGRGLAGAAGLLGRGTRVRVVRSEPAAQVGQHVAELLRGPGLVSALGHLPGDAEPEGQGDGMVQTEPALQVRQHRPELVLRPGVVAARRHLLRDAESRGQRVGMIRA